MGNKLGNGINYMQFGTYWLSNIAKISRANFIKFDFIFLNYYFLAYLKMNTIIKYNRMYLLRLSQYEILTRLPNNLKLKENRKLLQFLRFD